MIHRHALMVKYLEPILESVMHDVIKTVKFISGHALNPRLFRELCQNVEAEYTDLLYLANIIESINILNKELQGKNINIISVRQMVSRVWIKAAILETESRTEQDSFYFKVSLVFGSLQKYYFY